MISDWKKQFTLRELSLNHDNPIVFVSSQWQRDSSPSIIYLFYRLFMALTFLVIWILSIIGITDREHNPKFKAKWLIYLTNWGFTCCTVQAIISASILVGCFIAHRKTKSNLQEKALRFYKVYWVSYTIAADLALGITIVYWALLYDEKTMGMDPMNILVHGANTLLMLIDLCIISHPIRLLHSVYPCLLGLCYAIFSLIYYLSGGTGRDGNPYIYNILKWDKPGSAMLTCVGVMSFLVFLHIFNFGLFKLRQLLHSMIYPPPVMVEDVNLPEVDNNKMGYVNNAMTTENV